MFGHVRGHGRRRHPVSPAGQGRLARPWGEQTQRSASTRWPRAFDLDIDRPVVDTVEKIADSARRADGPGRAGLGAANPVVAAPIVGATKPHHLTDAVAALDITLTDDEIRALEEPYTPQAPYWW